MPVLIVKRFTDASRLLSPPNVCSKGKRNVQWRGWVGICRPPLMLLFVGPCFKSSSAWPLAPVLKVFVSLNVEYWWWLWIVEVIKITYDVHRFFSCVLPIMIPFFISCELWMKNDVRYSRAYAVSHLISFPVCYLLVLVVYNLFYNYKFVADPSERRSAAQENSYGSCFVLFSSLKKHCVFPSLSNYFICKRAMISSYHTQPTRTAMQTASLFP